MTLRAAAALTVLLTSARARLARQEGQGTVEYVALILLVAGVMAIVVKSVGGFGPEQLGKAIVGKLKDSIDGVGDPPKAGG